MVFKSIYKNKKTIGIYSLFIICVGGFILKLSPEDPNKRDISSFTTFAERGSLPGLINASGQLESQKIVVLGPKKQGVLKEIYVNAGDEVEKNQLLALMEKGDLIFRINEFKAEYEKQKANFERGSFLYNEGAITKEKYEEYKNLFLKSEARLNQVKIEKEDLSILAPFKGKITNRFSEPGAFVAPSSNLSRSSSNSTKSSSSILELSQGIEVIAKVPESDVGRIKTGQIAAVRVDSFPEKRFKAKVEEISPKAIKENNVTSFEVKLSLIEPNSLLRLGMTADIEFQTGSTSISTLVPTVAIVTKNGIPGLLFVGEKKQPMFKEIQLGNSSGSKTAIIKGINPGEEIFIDLPAWAKPIEK